MAIVKLVAGAVAATLFYKKVYEPIREDIKQIYNDPNVDPDHRSALIGVMLLERFSPFTTGDSITAYSELSSLTDSTEYDYYINTYIDQDNYVSDPLTSEELNAIKPDAGSLNGGDNDAENKDTFTDDIVDIFESAEINASPLVLDLDGDGIELISLNSSDAVYWDIDLDGFSEATGWASPDDGFLVVDINDNGIIDDSSELFGDQTGFENGFLALKEYDSNGDNLITNADAMWSDLLIWKDLNGDGISQANELSSLDNLLITEIDLGYTDVSTIVAGNSIYQESTFTIDGNSRDIADVYFKYSNYNSVYSAEHTIDLESLLLPMLDGSGDLPFLTASLSLDNNGMDSNSLISLVSDFSDLTQAQLFTDNATVMDDVADIMYRWAGVDSVSQSSRGPNIDGRQLEFLEKIMGQEFLQRGYMTEPGFNAAEDLKEGFLIAQNNIYARLAAQGVGCDLFTGDIYYDVAADSIQGITGIDSTVLAQLETAAGSASSPDVYWQNVIRMVEFTIGTTNLSAGDQTDLDDAITNTTSTDLSGIVSSLDYDAADGVDYNGTSSGETITGGTGWDDIDAGAGNDILYGGLGNDTIDGDADDDNIYGENGNDYLRGGLGEDTYHYSLGDGWDIIREQGTGSGNTNDRILFAAGITLADLTITRISNTDLQILIDTGSQTGEILIENQFNYSTGEGHVETLEFSDASTYDLAAQDYTLTGTDRDETLRGSRYASTGIDTIYGGAGNDIIYADAANESDFNANTLYGEEGNDELHGDGGADSLFGGIGDDILEGNGGDDFLNGGTGTDHMEGGTGNDTYHFVTGIKTIEEQSGSADKITLAAIWDSNTPDYFRIVNDLQIFFDTQNHITIQGYYNSNGAVETLLYDDATSIDLTSISYTDQGTASNNFMTGTSGDDTLYGFGGNDRIDGNAGNDNLFGGTGNDKLYGEYGNDYLDGGAGDDLMLGGQDDDTYFYVSGFDIMREINGTDVLELASGWSFEDLNFYINSGDSRDLVIDFNDGSVNSITIEDMFYSTRQIETLRFNDGGSDFDLTSLHYTTYGTEGNNYLDGILSSYINGGNTNDILYGLGGDDDLEGKNGNDILYGGDGNDDLDGDAGDDILYGGDGFDIMRGEGGADTFVFESASAFNDIDEIDDFDVSENDVLDLSDLLGGYDPLNDAITDFVEITTSGADSIVKVDVDGGADNFVQVAFIDGTNGLTDEAALEAAGRLITS